MDCFIQTPKTYIAIDIGVKHFAYCKIQDKQGDTFLLSFNLIEINKGNKINDLINFVNSNYCDALTLIIEQQVKNNVEAMIIQNILMTICIIRNINYVLFNPKNKFTYIEGNNVKLTYRQRKNKSIEYARIYLNKYHKEQSSLSSCGTLGQSPSKECKDMLNEFEKFDKKDDVADAIVMAVMYKLNMDKTKIKDMFKV